MDNITFKEVDVLGKDFEQYKTLNNHLFKVLNYSNAWINWYFNLFQFIRTYGAFDAEKLIGIWSVEPRLFKYNNRIISIGRCFATGIHETYRRRGIFVELSKFALEKEKERGEYKYIVGFPTKGRSVIGGHLKAGWYSVQEIEVRELYIENIKTPLNLHNVDTKLMDDFHFSDGEFCPKSFERYRWLQHPENFYICLSLIRGKGHIILKPYKDFCHILELQAKHQTHARMLLQVAAGLCKQHQWTKLTAWCADNDPYTKTYEDIGFLSNSANSRIVMIAYNITAKNNMKLRRSHIQTGIEEMY